MPSAGSTATAPTSVTKGNQNNAVTRQHADDMLVSFFCEIIALKVTFMISGELNWDCSTVCEISYEGVEVFHYVKVPLSDLKLQEIDLTEIGSQFQ